MPQPDHHPTVLVIGAEPGLIGEFLAARSCQVVHAPSGADAVALAQRHRPRLVIMDLDLDNLDPYEMTIDLEAMPETRGAAIVTIVSDPEDDEAIRPRCRGRLVRPVAKDDLATVLAPCLESAAPAPAPDGDASVACTGRADSNGHGADLRERIERLEMELARTQEALASLYEQQLSLRRVAHLAEEMAQPMTLVMGYAEMLPADLSNLGAARTDCDIIAEQVKRMARTLSLLRRIAPGHGPPAPRAPAENGP